MLKSSKSADKKSLNNQFSTSINLIGIGTEVIGDIKVKGDLRIDGKVSGNIQCASKVVLGPTGLVKGNISSVHADISGLVNGNLKVNEYLFLKSGGTVNGDLEIRHLVVEEKGVFNGKCTMIKNGGDMNALKVNQEKTPIDQKE